MRCRAFLNYLVTMMLGLSFMLYGQQSRDNNHLTPFTNFGSNTGASFSGSNLFLHSTAYLATYMIVESDIDFRVHKYFSQNLQYDPYTTPSVWLGYTMPLVLGGGLYGFGKANQNDEMVTAGYAVLQASLISQLYVSLLKAVTGRPNPDPKSFSDMKEASRTFRFGFLRGGLHYGWPSGHLAVNTAAITSLMAYYPRNITVKILGGVYLAYLFFGVSAHEGATMHWFSDVVAGSLIGLAIGPTVGRSFRGMYDAYESSGHKATVRLTPILGTESTGISFTVVFRWQASSE